MVIREVLDNLVAYLGRKVEVQGPCAYDRQVPSLWLHDDTSQKIAIFIDRSHHLNQILGLVTGMAKGPEIPRWQLKAYGTMQTSPSPEFAAAIYNPSWVERLNPGAYLKEHRRLISFPYSDLMVFHEFPPELATDLHVDELLAKPSKYVGMNLRIGGILISKRFPFSVEDLPKDANEAYLISSPEKTPGIDQAFVVRAAALCHRLNDAPVEDRQKYGSSTWLHRVIIRGTVIAGQGSIELSDVSTVCATNLVPPSYGYSCFRWDISGKPI